MNVFKENKRLWIDLKILKVLLSQSIVFSCHDAFEVREKSDYFFRLFFGNQGLIRLSDCQTETSCVGCHTRLSEVSNILYSTDDLK